MSKHLFRRETLTIRLKWASHISIAPQLRHPVRNETVATLLQALNAEPSQLRQVTPIASTSAMLPLSLDSRTLIMSILNITPDSFSDGGRHFSVSDAVEAAQHQVAAGADVLDVGGVSTRPGSVHVTEEEELHRVIPVIQAIREAGISTPISVDTYRASVARQSIEAGADIINDISGGLKDPAMLETVAELDVPFVLMHMRGEPEEVNQPRHQKYEGGDVVSGVRSELAQAVRKALEAGIKRWNIILDPGVGFSKNAQGNLQLLRDLPAVTGRQLLPTRSPLLLQGTKEQGKERDAGDADSALLCRFPVLVGISRKGFLGKITGQAVPTKREYANSAVHALAIANGANIIRVHDVAAAQDAAKVADAIYGRQ